MSQTTEIQEEAPEGYKRVQLGPKTLQVPIDWQIKRVDKITKNLDRKREPIKESERENGDVPYYGATGQVDSVSGHLFDEKLVLVGEDGADWSPFGGTSYIISGKSWVNNHVHVLRCTNVVEEFLSNYLDYIEMRHVITGTNRGKLNQSELNQFPVLFPPLPEQRRISDILSTVDEQIQQTDETIKKTTELKRGLMQDFFRPSVQNGRSTKLGDVPDTWETGQIREFGVSFISGGTPSRENPEYYGGEIPWLKTSEVQNCRVRSSEESITKSGLEESSAAIVPPGSVLVAMYGGGTVGNVGLLEIEAATNQACCAINTEGSVLNNEFLYYQLLFEHRRLVSYAAGSSQQNLSKHDVEQFDILVPPEAEQQRITAVLSQADEKLTQEREQKQYLQELKHGLMQDLLTGKVRVDTD